MRPILFFILAVILFFGCTPSYDTHEKLSDEDYTKFLQKVAPYVIKKPDEITYAERFDPVNWDYYQNFINATEGKIEYYLKNDTAYFFFFSHKDHTSLYEHYRGLGGYLKYDEAGNIVFLNLLYHTPRFTAEEMSEKGKDLFHAMVTKGNVDQYVGDQSYIQTPNADFYYDTKRNRWDYTENSSWKFLEEAKQQAESDSTAN